jgi:hypothetical protein
MIKFIPTSATSYLLYPLYFNKILKLVGMITLLGVQLVSHLTCKGHINLLLHTANNLNFK